MTFDEFLREACPPLDLEWRKYRRRSARHRLQARLRELGLADYESYLERLRADSQEAAALADRLRVTVTRFFRERQRWQVLADAVIPSLLAARDPERPLRAWSAGCAGGEEPYTLAILWLAAVRPHYPGRSLQILATDIDPSSLARARAAVYEAAELREVPPEIRGRFFLQRRNRWSPVPAAVALVEIAPHNLMRDAPPGIFDLVCCRYLPFTYYRRERRLEATRRLRQALAPDGALMIGAREELGSAASLFARWPGAPGVFRPRAERSPTDFEHRCFRTVSGDGSGRRGWDTGSEIRDRGTGREAE